MPDHPQFTFHKTQPQTPLPLLSLHVSQNKGQSDRSTTLNRRLMGKHTTKRQEWKGRPRSAGRASQQPPGPPAASAHLCAPYRSNSSRVPTPGTSHDPHPSRPSLPAGPIPGPGPTAALLQPRSPIPPCPGPASAPAASGLTRPVLPAPSCSVRPHAAAPPRLGHPAAPPAPAPPAPGTAAQLAPRSPHPA